MSSKIGVLYGIGVGPGDPDLIPLKSVKILQKVDVVFAASSTKNSHSQAVNIAQTHIPATTQVQLLRFPMTKEQRTMAEAWQLNSKIITDVLASGKSAAFLTLGDPLTYSTFGYILKYLQKNAPQLPIQTIPGISAYQAAAARCNKPLVEGEESLLIISGVKGGDQLRKRMGISENVVFFKAYKNTKDIVAAIEEADLIENSFGVANCSLPDEKVIKDIQELKNNKPGYWTLIVAQKKKHADYNE